MQLRLDGQRSRRETAEYVALQKRLVNLRGRISQPLVASILSRLLYLAAEAPRTPILIEIDSPGGLMTQVSDIMRVMDRISCPIATFCRGQVRGPGLAIAAHGRRGLRVAAPGCRFSVASSSAEDGPELLPAALTQVILKDATPDPSQSWGWLEAGAEFGSQEALRRGLIDAISPRPLCPEVAIGRR